MPTCCCRSRRSRRRRARSSTARAAPQSFHGVVQPAGDARPGWKVLRVLGTMLKLPGFEFDTSEQVRDAVLAECGDLKQRLSNNDTHRRSPRPRDPLPASSASPTCRSISPTRWCGVRNRCRQPPTRSRRGRGFPRRCSTSSASTQARRSRSARVAEKRFSRRNSTPSVPPGVVRIAAAHPSTCGLEGLSGPITVERA